MPKILTESKKLNYAIILLFIDAVILVISGALYAISGTFMSYHVEYTGLTESDVKVYSSKLMFVISSLIRLLGIYEISLGITIMFITFYGIRKKEKWAWWNSLVASFIIIIPQLIMTFMITGFLGMPFLLTIIYAILLIIALSFSYNEIF